MFSPDIVDSDAFLDMPSTSQLLYFHLAMRADDDGFVSPKKVMRLFGAGEDDLKVLLVKRFVLLFESGVIVIKHWLIHNLIRADRYRETNYKIEKAMLGLNEYGAYTELSGDNAIKKISVVSKPKWLNERQQARKESDLPDSFDYKIRQAFVGKKCPICGNEMKESSVENIEYGMKYKPSPSIQHNIPISKGGKHELGNISVICHSCNVSTQDKETGELNAKEVIDVWHTVGNQSAPQVRDRLELGINTGGNPTDSAFNNNYLSKFKNPKKVYSSAGLLAAEINEWDKRLGFPMLLRLIKVKGEQFIRETWSEVKKSDAKEPHKLFMYKIGQVKVELKNQAPQENEAVQKWPLA